MSMIRREFQLAIRLDNAAFDGRNGPYEVARLLRKVAKTIEDGLSAKSKILDINGNTAGSYGVKLVRY